MDGDRGTDRAPGAPGGLGVADADDTPDPRRWITLAILLATVLLVTIDTSVLNVAFPTILHELDTTVPTLQWVVTGYSLTLASLLLVGGRLGDVFGHRRMFMVGVSLFGVGSLIASMATSVAVLVIGEAVIEGVGAALMLPSTLAIMSTSFGGRERATAFAVWGAFAGIGSAFGPLLGGYLTTHHSWRWSFRINVVVAPIALIGAMVLMRRTARRARVAVDGAGAVLISAALFLLVFALSEGGHSGWAAPSGDFAVGGVGVWPRSMPVAAAPAALSLAVLFAVLFVAYERRRERAGVQPLFEFSMLRFPTVRYGLVTLLILSMGQLGVLFSMPLFLQDALGRSPQDVGLWLLPLGLSVVAGAQLAGRLTRVVDPVSAARLGLAAETIGLFVLVATVRSGVGFTALVPGLVVTGVGMGAAGAQLTSISLAEVPVARSGVAGGASATVRQMGAALGIAVMGSLIDLQTTKRAVASLARAPLEPVVRAEVIAGVAESGPSYVPPAALSARDASVVERIMDDALAFGTRSSLLFAGTVVAVGAGLCWLIPPLHKVAPHRVAVRTRGRTRSGKDAVAAG